LKTVNAQFDPHERLDFVAIVPEQWTVESGFVTPTLKIKRNVVEQHYAAASGLLQWRNRNAPCPVDPALRQACLRTRRAALQVYWASVLLFAVGGWFAFVQPLL
jgi:hypothetical protein